MQTEFLQNGLTLEQLQTQFPLGTDAMLLADFAKNCGHRVCDLCAGCGQIGMLLVASTTAEIVCVELQEEACSQAQQNIRRNGLDSRMKAIQGDLRQIKSLLPHNSFDTVVCNPPYYPVSGGYAAKDTAIAISRTELCCTLSDVCAAASWLLPTGGSLYLCHKPERLTDLLTCLRSQRLEPKRLRFVQHRQDSPFSLVLTEAVAGGKPGLSVLPTLTLQNADRTPTTEYRKIYHLEDS